MIYKHVLVTGGAGFIGSNLLRLLLKQHPNTRFFNLDALTYAGNLATTADLEQYDNYTFIKGSTTHEKILDAVFSSYHIDAVIHLAAESHVDNSIDDFSPFVNSNILGTINLLKIAYKYWKKDKIPHRFYHISTDEVFGSLDDTGIFTERSPYQPRSPYSASKAAADHWVMAFANTYQLPTVLSYCSNNYGPFQYPEKLIPYMIRMALANQPLPIYGNGRHIRDWIFVTDHVKAINLIFCEGKTGEKYCIGAHQTCTNLYLVTLLCEIMDKKLKPQRSYKEYITFVKDRAGHDYRYAIDTHKIATSLGWEAETDLTSGLEMTVNWYLSNQEWINAVNGA